MNILRPHYICTTSGSARASDDPLLRADEATINESEDVAGLRALEGTDQHAQETVENGAANNHDGSSGEPADKDGTKHTEEAYNGQTPGGDVGSAESSRKYSQQAGNLEEIEEHQV